ncbi:hypothetical protein EI94DRAFT_1807099 [Lactarius quietus]|nr:hypothetical protein EI94DRAFT_1807099 [Lactarius quietus]
MSSFLILTSHDFYSARTLRDNPRHKYGLDIMTKPLPLFSQSSTSSLENPSSTTPSNPPDDGEARYFLHLYICSYTPALSAFI